MYAFTELHNDYPAFVNLSEQPDGTLKLSVRTRGNGGKEYASIALAPDVAEELAEAIFKHVHADEAPVAQPVTPLQAPDQAQEQAINAAAREVADCYEAGYDCTVVIEKYRLAKKGNSKVKVGTTAETIDAALNAARYLILRSDEYAADVVIGAFGGDTADTKDWGKSLDEWCDAAIKTMAPQDSAQVDATPTKYLPRD